MWLCVYQLIEAGGVGGGYDYNFGMYKVHILIAKYFIFRWLALFRPYGGVTAKFRRKISLSRCTYFERLYCILDSSCKRMSHITPHMLLWVRIHLAKRWYDVSSVSLAILVWKNSNFQCATFWRPLKEVLWRENHGLKVYPVAGSSVFSTTGTYFWFVLSML